MPLAVGPGIDLPGGELTGPTSDLSIYESARKHGVGDADILHAVRNPMKIVRQATDRVLYIGPDRQGDVLEVVVLDGTGDDLTVIHAMRLRPKFYRYLR